MKDKYGILIGILMLFISFIIALFYDKDLAIFLINCYGIIMIIIGVILIAFSLIYYLKYKRK